LKLPPLPEKLRLFLCTKCGGTACKDSIELQYPACNNCGYYGFACDTPYSDEDLTNYGKLCAKNIMIRFSVLISVSIAVAVTASVFVTLLLN
jgi:hypothetical protein